MKKNLLLSMCVMLFAAANISAQDSVLEDQWAILEKRGFVPGKIITLTGDTIEGYIHKMNLPTEDEVIRKSESGSLGAYAPLYQFGKNILFYEEKDFWNNYDNRKAKQKYKAKELAGYIYDYTGDKRVFESQLVKSMQMVVSGRYFVEKVTDCKNGDRIYKFMLPVDVVNIHHTIEDVRCCFVEYDAMIPAGEKSVILIRDQIIKKFYAKRCPQVVEKFNNGDYTNVTDKKDSKLNKLAKLSAYVGSDEEKDAIALKAFIDYLKLCGE